MKLYVNGFPGLYGGAATELHHQIPVWRALGFQVHLVPTRDDYKTSAVFKEALETCVIHAPNALHEIEAHAPVLGFCSRDFLRNLPAIRRKTENTIFVNCMTWLFEEEKLSHARGLIKAFLYQNDDVMQSSSSELQRINVMPTKYLRFVPNFDTSKFPYVAKRNPEVFGVGRISRQDKDKYSKHTMKIYDGFVSPKVKSGLFVGFDGRSQEKTGKPLTWIKTAKNQNECSQQDFYKHCDIVLQPTDTVENWPRVGLEAMASGSVLVVDNRGGWRRMVEHGKTGWLCDNHRDFIYYASKMAYEPEVRQKMAEAGRARVAKIAGFEESKASWKRVLEAVVS